MAFFSDSWYPTFDYGKQQGIVQIPLSQRGERQIVATENPSHQLTLFSSCNYLDLAFDDRLIQSSIEATRKWGTSVVVPSKTWASIDMVQEIEMLFEKMFDRPCSLFANSIMANASMFPALLQVGSLIVLDKEAHSTLHYASNAVIPFGFETKVIPTYDCDALRLILQQRLKEGNEAPVWYLTDGVESLDGRLAPVKIVEKMLHEFPNLHVYYDDAHGMSWTGKNGRGYVAENLKNHPRLFIVAGLSKGPGALGAVVATPDKEWKRRLDLAGIGSTFGALLPPATLGALKASVMIHLSPEIKERQEKLQENIRYFRGLLSKAKIPAESPPGGPICYLSFKNTDQVVRVAKALLAKGFMIHVFAFPAVKKDRPGIRMLSNVTHTKEQMDALVETLAKEYHAIFGTSNL